MLVRVVLSVEIRGGEEAAFEREFREVAAGVRMMSGCLGQALCRNTADPASYAIMSDWGSREEFQRFETSTEQHELTAPVRRHRVSARMAVYEVMYEDVTTP